MYFLTHELNMCLGCSKEPSHLDGSIEPPQHMFWLRNKKIIFQYALLSEALKICQFFNNVSAIEV